MLKKLKEELPKETITMNSSRKIHKILMIGNSSVRNCATEHQNNMVQIMKSPVL